MSLLSLKAASGLILLVALDGAICLLMALPLAVPLTLLGAGGGMTAMLPVKSTQASVWMCLTFPALVGFESVIGLNPKVRQVTTSVTIDAPIEDVWDTVIAFPKIESRPGWIFRLGVAYPIEATIEGRGVGACRYCTFSTGEFVEPITVWNPPHQLTFKVAECPPPMRELSIYGELDTPHLHGYLVSERGAFRLSQQGDQVLLDGSTWYSHPLDPEFYWGAGLRRDHPPNSFAGAGAH